MEKIVKCLTQEELKARLTYCPDSGIFIWLNNPNKPTNWNQKYAGTRAGSSNNIRRTVCIDTISYLEHRLAFLYMTAHMPPEIDHKNGDSNDNRWCNLREVSHTENMQNKKLYSSNVSGVSGVTWCAHANKWRARIRIEGVLYDRGRFHNMADAIRARKAAEKEFGFTNYQQHNKNS